MIKYAGIISDSVVDGTGIRLVTFLRVVQGIVRVAIIRTYSREQRTGS
jgi:hypothetical protein